jgi:hypothetical protein
MKPYDIEAVTTNMIVYDIRNKSPSTVTDFQYREPQAIMPPLIRTSLLIKPEEKV